MTKAVDRDLRKDLLLKALERFTDLDQAFDAVLRMERFVLEGITQGDVEEAASTTAVSYNRVTETRAADGPGEISTGAKRISGLKRRWGQEEDARLRELCDQSYTVKEIAAELERSPASIYGRMNQFGLSVVSQRPNRFRRTSTKTSETDDKVGAKVEALPKPHAVSENSGGRIDDGVTIDEVVHFLRTRDYSVVSTKDGCFKVDGRQIMTASDLLQRANRVRESIGRSPWTTLHEPPLADENRFGRDNPKAKRNSHK